MKAKVVSLLIILFVIGFMGHAFALSEYGVVKLYQQRREALKYFEESLKIYRKINILQYIAISFNNIGAIYVGAEVSSELSLTVNR